MATKIRPAAELTAERKKWKANEEKARHEKGMQRAANEILKAHHDKLNQVTLNPAVPDSVVKVLRDKGYKVYDNEGYTTTVQWE